MVRNGLITSSLLYGQYRYVRSMDQTHLKLLEDNAIGNSRLRGSNISWVLGAHRKTYSKMYWKTSGRATKGLLFSKQFKVIPLANPFYESAADFAPIWRIETPSEAISYEQIQVMALNTFSILELRTRVILKLSLALTSKVHHFYFLRRLSRFK